MIGTTTALLLVVCLTAKHSVYCQDAVDTVRVDSRSSNEKSTGSEVGGGQSRNIFNPRHLSPHQMMHFGKRPTVAAPPMIIPAPTSSLYDLYPAPHRIQKYPYLLSLELGDGRILEQLPEEFVAPITLDVVPPRSRIFNHRRPVQMAPGSDGRAGFLRQESMKLVSDKQEQASDDEQVAGGEKAQTDSRSDSRTGNSQDISVSSRSVPIPRQNLNPMLVTAILYGNTREPFSLDSQNLGEFKKKAEPKKNLFMHFG